MSSNLFQKTCMAEGVEDSTYFILILTKMYSNKVNLQTGQPENCNLEFTLALTKKGVDRMIVIVRDATMLNPRLWEGKIGFCGANLYIDGTSLSLKEVVGEVLKRLRREVRKRTLTFHLLPLSELLFYFIFPSFSLQFSL